MTLQHSMRKAEIKHFIDKVDDAASGLVTKPPEATPPVYGGPQRDAINSVVDNIIGDICGKIGVLHKTLDGIEQQLLQSAAKSKHSLNEHVAICIKLNDEVVHMQDVIKDLAETARET